MRKDEIRTQKIIRKLNKEEEKKKQYDNNELNIIEPRVVGGCLVLVIGFILIAIVSIIKWLC